MVLNYLSSYQSPYSTQRTDAAVVYDRLLTFRLKRRLGFIKKRYFPFLSKPFQQKETMLAEDGGGKGRKLYCR